MFHAHPGLGPSSLCGHEQLRSGLAGTLEESKGFMSGNEGDIAKPTTQMLEPIVSQQNGH